MVKAVPHDFPARGPIKAVVERRDSKENQRGRKVDCGPAFGCAGGRKAGEDNRGRQRQRCGDKVNPTPQVGLNRYLLSGKPLGGFEGSDFHECLHERSTYACVTYYTVGYANLKGKAAVFR